ncbi:MAG TPA: hypothetical protein PLZ36_03605 [Armatimonadota bacterium]|nr:hypothetical protein [Armatimonadota bacterium]HOS42072.1 hypothetical protein [Armatimonadota bacterium]
MPSDATISAARALIATFTARDTESVVNAIPNAEAWAWLEAHIPFFECPDPVIQTAYYFRWWTFRKHIRRTPAGYVITEFLPEVSWAGAHNTIACAAGHHLYEGRWLREPGFARDYLRFWFTPEAAPRFCAWWASDAALALHRVHPDLGYLRAVLPDLLAHDAAWERHYRDANGLFWHLDTPNEDGCSGEGMEYSLGGSGCRPSFNSYMYGDARALAELAELAGDAATARAYRGKAAALKARVQALLWDDDAHFFKTLPTETALEQHWRCDGAGYTIRRDILPRHAPGALVDVRELIGYVPWYFNLPDAGYEAAWAQLLDPRGFLAPYGPTTCERRHPLFMTDYLHDCLWDGPSWPYATAQTLTALANLLNHYAQAVISAEDYLRLLHGYARSHQLARPDGRVDWWIDENLHPDTGVWLARHVHETQWGDCSERGKDYNHSTFCDLVITGAAGLRPRTDGALEVNPLARAWDWFRLDDVPYRGHAVTITYDRTGDRYGAGPGLRVLVDGEVAAAREAMGKIIVTL